MSVKLSRWVAPTRKSIRCHWRLFLEALFGPLLLEITCSTWTGMWPAGGSVLPLWVHWKLNLIQPSAQSGKNQTHWQTSKFTVTWDIITPDMRNDRNYSIHSSDLCLNPTAVSGYHSYKQRAARGRPARSFIAALMCCAALKLRKIKKPDVKLGVALRHSEVNYSSTPHFLNNKSSFCPAAAAFQPAWVIVLHLLPPSSVHTRTTWDTAGS